MTKEELNKQYDNLQLQYGSQNYNAVYGGGQEQNPKLCLVFMNPTARNIATDKNWNGIRYQWLGTKQVWKFLSSCNLFDESLTAQIQKMKPIDWAEEFCKIVYNEVTKQNIYITNLAKCTQDDARPLPKETFLAYRDLLLAEFDLIRPQKIILFGNEVASIVLNQKVSVGTTRKQKLILKTNTQTFDCYPVYYPVGNGFFNTGKAVEDLKQIMKE